MRSILLLLFIVSFSSLSGQDVGQRQDALELYRQGHYRDSVEICRQELETFDLSRVVQRLDSYTVMGWSLLRLGEYDKAYDTGVKARKESRFDIRIIHIMGEASYYKGHNERALSLFQEYIKQDPDDAKVGQVYSMMGEIYLRLSWLEHADMAYSTALFQAPNSASLWSRLGYIREQADHIHEASLAYKEALKLNPSQKDARDGLERVAKIQ